jgi:hypothetical protein
MPGRQVYNIAHLLQVSGAGPLGYLFRARTDIETWPAGRITMPPMDNEHLSPHIKSIRRVTKQFDWVLAVQYVEQ